MFHGKIICHVENTLYKMTVPNNCALSVQNGILSKYVQFDQWCMTDIVYLTSSASSEIMRQCKNSFLHVVIWCCFTVGDTEECMDRVANISGSMTCQQFLTRYGFQYCSYKYMQRNCCASQRAICAPTLMQN